MTATYKGLVKCPNRLCGETVEIRSDKKGRFYLNCPQTIRGSVVKGCKTHLRLPPEVHSMEGVAAFGLIPVNGNSVNGNEPDADSVNEEPSLISKLWNGV